ncbi:NACHT domain-containing protein [Otariodibacter oris]|uniref:NACHT domain-containing protein n=1 Tax=Otariodibacter oris TaxID=1032623 RepID=A0A420XEB0_9PAST|nr:NACHT domain-containing protein [Otariodibacter oris]QGM80132.1 hypothetical protein A6A10_01265 [Otariodibacter oris]RKR70476.1 NACHT domain-containing protein [Otariodibacter oris]
MNNVIPDEITSLIINKAIDSISYFRQAHKVKSIFSSYLNSRYEKLSIMKTLLYRNEPVKLSECYVRNSVTFIDNDRTENVFKDHNIKDFILKNKRVILSGTAGIGKSVFCKSIFLEMVNNANGIYPIFIELRELKNNASATLIEYICNEISYINEKISSSNLESLIKKGNILFILDGFDEIDFDIREKYTREILEISKKYSDIRILISSRPEEIFQSWEQFYVLNMNELSKKQAKELIKKLRYDENLKNKFIQEIDKKLYKTHKSFVGNPLLLTMMLMSFEEFAEIPRKIHLFYEQAFLTLFRKHDALKSSYYRKSRSGMDINDFRKVLAYFSINTHIKNEITIPKDKAKEILHKGLKSLGKENIKAGDVLQDIMSNLCLLHNDGINVTFSHRSFQEYFSALYLKELNNPEKIYKLIDKTILSNNSNIHRMLYDMNSEFLEKNWIIPKIKENKANIKINLNLSEKELKIFDIMTSFFIIETKSENKNINQTILFNYKITNISHYNHTDFYKDLWMFLFEKIEFTNEESQSIMLSETQIPKEIKKITKKIIETYNIINNSYDKLSSRVLHVKLESIKSRLDYNEYSLILNFIYKQLFINRINTLDKIKDYLEIKHKDKEDNIDELLDY